MRLFVAVDPGPEALARCTSVLAELTPIAPRSRWVDPTAFHVTLVFLGAVEDARIAVIDAAIAAVAAAAPPIDLGIAAGGTFGSKRSPRVLWLGLTGEVDRLRRLQGMIADALAPLGFPREARAYSPHLTLARAREPRGDPSLVEACDRLGAIATSPERIRGLALYRSHLGPRGARYQVARTYPFASDDG